MDIVIISYNNYKYVDNTVKQLQKMNNPNMRLIIMDNNSDDPDTIDYLKSIELLNQIRIIFNKKNEGPWVTDKYNKEVYDSLPEKFILTDPDLEFNPNLPNNFIEVLFELSDTYKLYKIGFALDISDYDKMYKTNNYVLDLNIYQWEIRFWAHRVIHEEYELYNAVIDTTFCLVNKKHFQGNNQMRIAGDFTAKHLPWYIPMYNQIYNVYDTYQNAKKNTKISTISKIINNYINNNYLEVIKNNELFLVHKNDSNVEFWNNKFPDWKRKSFEVFDKYLNTTKIFIDISDSTKSSKSNVLYSSRKSKHVYYYSKNNSNSIIIQNNCNNNYTLINNLESIIHIINNNLINISLINVELRGDEEHIFNKLLLVNHCNNIPLFITFNYDLWTNKDLNRFSYLNDHIKTTIVTNPSSSILFT